ncbi:MAG: FHA domain-containing protein [Phototrophicaceae bacterium]
MNEPTIERPILIELLENNQTRQQFVLESDDVTVGRGEESGIVIPRRQVSRVHIRIYKEGNRVILHDLDSKNGTWINGVQLKGKTELNDGDEINLAMSVRLKYVASGSTVPLPFALPEVIGGRLRLDREAHRIFINGKEIDPPLSPPQYRLVELLYINSGNVCTREAVIDTVWPETLGEGVSEQAIDALVRRLRDRLSELDPTHQYIVTMRGHGFRLDNPHI